MSGQKKEIKKAQAYTLKPVNIAWISEQALEKSTSEKRVSASAVLDQIVDQARLNAEIVSKSEKKSRTSIQALAA